MADGDEEPDSPAAELDDQSLRGRQPITAGAGRDASAPSERTIVDTSNPK